MFRVISTRGKKTTLRAFSGLAGSPASTVKISIPPFKQTVVVHFCFDQERGELKPDRCKCDLRVLRDEAYQLTDSDQADWLLVKTKTEKLAKFHRAIVIRRAIVNGEILFALTPSVKPSARDAKHESIKTQIRLKARRILQKLLASGNLSPQDAQLSDADLESAIVCPEPFLERIGARKQTQVYWRAISVYWWNNILGFHRLNIDAGKFLTHAEHGKGLVTTGTKEDDTDSARLSRIDGAEETDTGKVPGGSGKAHFWNGGWSYSPGVDPQAYETGEVDGK